MFRVPKFFTVGFLLIFSSLFALGQDLGLGGGLSSKKPKAASSTASKKSKTTPAKTKKTTPKTTVASNKKTTPVKTVKKEETQPPVEITPVKPKVEFYNERFELAIEEGNKARDERDYFKAELAYRKAHAIGTDDYRAIYGLGNIYSDQRRWDEAEKAYREAIRIDPTAPDAYIALSFVLAQPISANDLLDRFAEAETFARRAIQLDPQNPYAFDQLGVALELRGIINEETEKAYRSAIKIDPNAALAYAHLGRLLRKKGQLNQSTEAYNNAIRLATDVPTMILVAEVMQSQQRFTESEQLLRRALRDDPKNPTALFLLGRALTTRANFAEAEIVLRKSLEVSPNNFNGYMLLGSLYSRQEKLPEAEKELFKALQVVSPNERNRLSTEFETVGDAYMRAGKRKDAARIYQQAASLDTEKSSLSDKLARAKGD
jgi:superkiller protein 3